MTPYGRPGGAAPTAEVPQAAPTEESILTLLAGLRRDGLEFWRRLEAERFWSRHDGNWSPADNIHHLMISTAPVTRALRIPRLLLRACFGVTRTPSRSWEALRSAREMLMFTLFHFDHHRNNVARRLIESGGVVRVRS